jgi:hypothetical protein
LHCARCESPADRILSRGRSAVAQSDTTPWRPFGSDRFPDIVLGDRGGGRLVTVGERAADAARAPLTITAARLTPA